MRITQKTLARFTTLRNEIEALTAEFKTIKGDLIAQLEEGISVQKGERVAELKAYERRIVPWKDVVIRLKSEGYADKVLAATKPEPYVKLVVR